MNKSDCVIIDIEEGTECPLCCNIVSAADMAHSCKKNICGHNVCKNCVADLKKNGLKTGCIYCGDRPEEGNMIVVSSNAATHATRAANNHTNHLVIVQPNRGYYVLSINIDNCCGMFCLGCIMLLILFTVYFIGIVFFQIAQIIGHWINNQDHTHEIEFSLRNSVIGYVIWFCFAYIVLQIVILVSVMTEKCCIPCRQNYYLPCYRKIKSLCSYISGSQ